MKKINYVTRPYIHKSGRVLVRVRWNSSKSETSFSTGTSADPKKWNADTNRAKLNTTHIVNGVSYSAKEINGCIETVLDVISQVFYKYEVAEKDPTTEEVKNDVNKTLDGMVATRKLFVVDTDNEGKGALLTDLLSEFLKVRPTEVNWSEKVHLRYTALVDKLVKCYGKNEIRLMDINKQMLTDFRVWFFDETKHKSPYSNYTVKKHFRNLKGLLRWGKDNGYKINPESLAFQSNINTISKTVTFLEFDEIERLASYEFPENKKYLDKVRDVFCFSCYTSLRHSDLKMLRKANIKGDMMEIVTQKTDDRLRIPLIPQAKRILDKYKDMDGEMALPVVSDQKSNTYIKEAAMIAGLDREIVEVNMIGNKRVDKVNKLYETISMHDARRSFVCNSLAFGISTNVVSACTGHSDLNTMRPYIATTDTSVKKEMKKWGLMPIRKKIDAILDEATEDMLTKMYELIKGIA